MLRSLFSGVSGMRGFQNKLDVIGNNIANVNTVGFKSGRVMFKDILSQTITGVTAPVEGVSGGINAKQIGLGVTTSAVDTLFNPGSSMITNVSTDIRIDGDGFFALSATADGSQEVPFLSRAGNFTLDSANQLVNADGLFVLSSKGEPIKLDADVKSFVISPDGTIVSIATDGTATPTAFKIGLVKVNNPNGLEKIGGNLFRITGNSNPGAQAVITTPRDSDAGTGILVSGQLEMSNVDLTNEFTDMIVAQRGFQANSRVITTSDEIMQELVNLKR